MITTKYILAISTGNSVMKNVILLSFTLFLMIFQGYSQPTFDLSGMINGSIKSVVPVELDDWACLTDQGEIIYYFDDEYHNLNNEEVPILVMSNEFPDGKDSLLNLGDVTFEKLFGGEGYIWGITDRGLAISYSTRGYNYSMPIVNLPEVSEGTPLLKIITIPSVAYNDFPWFVGELYDGKKIVGALTQGIDELEESNEIRLVIDLDDIEGFSENYNFSDSHFNDKRKNFFAWDNENRVLMLINFGDVDYFVIPYDELPIDVEEILWIGTVGEMIYFDEPSFRRTNAFLYLLNNRGVLYRYWLHYLPMGNPSTNKGFGAVEFQNYNSIDTSDLYKKWAVWQEVGSDLLNQNTEKLDRPISIARNRYVYFGIKNEKQLLKYDQVYGDYCKVGLVDILDANLQGLSLPNFGRYTDYDSYAYSDKTITLLTDLEERNCSPVSVKHKNIPELSVETLRLNLNTVNIRWNQKYDALHIYGMGGQLIEQIRPEFNNGERRLPLDMNQSYILTAFKDGQVVGSKIFM